MSIGLPIPSRWAAEKLGIPAPEGDEPVLGATVGAGATAQSAALAAGSVLCNADDGGDYAGPEDDPTPVSAMVERLEEEAAPAWGRIMDAVRALVDEADSLEALRDALLASYGDLPTEKLSDAMTLAFAAAELAGRWHVELDSRGG